MSTFDFPSARFAPTGPSEAERLAAKYGVDPERARRMQEVTVRCALCPWSWSGLVGPEGAAELGRRHRAAKHPELPQYPSVNWRNAPPPSPRGTRRRPAAPEPPLRERAIALLGGGREATAAELAAELGETPASVAAALDWARRAGKAEARRVSAQKARVWRAATVAPSDEES